MRQRPTLDAHHGDLGGPDLGLGRLAGLDHERVIRPVRQWLKQRPLVALEAQPGLLFHGLMQSDIGRAVEPAPELGIEVGVVEELPAVEEVIAHVRDRALHLALGLGPIGAARPDLELVVRGEAHELGIGGQLLPAQRCRPW